MRYGFTTGSCAAAAAKAATYMLLTGKEKATITIETPKGIPFHAQIEEIYREETQVSCGVRKDGGDDPDVTTGALICATVSFGGDNHGIHIDGGIGVGRVTKRGLDQPVGNAAINQVPRKMIEKEVLEVCSVADFKGELLVTISVPDGEMIAEKTFNPRLGIQGGISILGTSGIVEPMSTQALLDTIQVELNMKQAEGLEVIGISPGNYGLDFMQKTYHYDLNNSVKCSNYIGDTIDMAAKTGFKGILLTGHIGKLIKLTGGMMNTHSKEGDCRMELMAAMGIRAGITSDTARAVLDCVATQGAIEILHEAHLLEATMKIIMEKACFYLEKRASGRLQIECIMYDNEYGELVKSKGADAMLSELLRG